MPPLLRLQGLPRPGRSRDEAEGAPGMKLKALQRISGVKEARRYHRNLSAACTAKESPGPPNYTWLSSAPHGQLR